MQEPGEQGAVAVLLVEVRELRAQVAALDAKLAALEGRSGMMSRSFWRRAFAAHGHVGAAYILLMVTVGLVVLLISGLAGAGGGPGPPVEATVAATRTPPPPRPTHTPLPSPAPSRAPTRTPGATATSPTGGCLSWRQITLDHVGRELCVWGYLSSVGDNGEAFFMYFGDRPGDFYALSYDWWYPEFQRRMCIIVEGKVERLGSSPVIVVGYQDAVYLCD